LSGICGIYQNGSEKLRMRLDPMLAALALPDEQERGFVSARSISLGVAQRWPGQQVGKISGVLIAVDADLTNVDQIKEALSPKVANTDRMELAELLAWLYVIQRNDFLDKLRGQFSIALWDEREQRLLLAIDRQGFKSLYWKVERDSLYFSSKASAIQAVQDFASEINPAAIMQFLLFSVVPAPLTIYRGMEKLKPGHLLIFEKGEVHQKQYWDVEYGEDSDHDEQGWTVKLREEMRLAVHRHVDGLTAANTGAYLSGGTDSSSVVAFMSERLIPVNTFSIAFPESRYNEIGFARTTAGRFHTKHSERQLAPQDALEMIPQIANYYDEPFANASAIAAYFCARMAREEGVDTLLAGDGGDEIFAGNERYAADHYFALYHRVPQWIRRNLLEPFVNLLPENGGRLSLPRKYVRRAQIPNPRRIFSYNFFFSLPPEEIFTADFVKEVPPQHWMDIPDSHFQAARASSELNKLMYLDLKLILADNDLRKVSGMAELAGVRVRYPLLDQRLMEFSGHIPSSLKMKGFEKRYIFKKAMTGILPDEVLQKKKHGFGVPLGQWLLKDENLKTLVQDVLNDTRTRQRGYFQPKFFDTLVKLHREGHAAYYGTIVWYLLALELWHRQHLESPREVAHVR
jgi:asparagine synthase (glutamine-hydrolysing)